MSNSRLMNMIRKGQVRGVRKGDNPGRAAFIAYLFGIGACTQQKCGAFRLLYSSLYFCNTAVAATPFINFAPQSPPK